MRPFQKIVYYTAVIISGIYLFSLLKKTHSYKEKENEVEAIEPTAIYELPNSIEVKPETKRAPQNKNGSIQMRLSHFEKLKGKVLLSPQESIERERILSDWRTLDWISSSLINPLSDMDLKSRLLMVDFLEGAITWEENPIRDEAVAFIKSVIFSGSYRRADKEIRLQLIGDKIELFTILSQEFPEEASELSAKVSGTKLESILKYAAKRLPINELKSEE